MKFHRFCALSLLLLGAVATLPAATIDFDFRSGGTNSGSGFGNVRTFTVGGVTITATAWSLTGNSGTTFQSSQLGQFSTGLGVCNRVEDTGCDSPNHQVDNVGSYDFVLFTFASPVDFYNITIDPFAPDDADRDVSYWVGNIATGTNLTGLDTSGFGTQFNVNNSASLNPITIDLGSKVGKSLLFGASFGQGDRDDYFKIKDLNTGSAVPEPATFGLAGLALIGLSAIKRVRKAS
jgi:hypothetical protein